MARPTFKQGAATSRTLNLIFLGGEQISLKDIREQASRKLHMSPTTLSSSLKSLETSGFVTRMVDVTERPPRVYYKRTGISSSQKGKTFDQWFEDRFAIIEMGLLIAINEIANSPNTPIEDLKIMSDQNIDGQAVRSLFDLFVLGWPWNIVSDFQQIIKSGGLRDEQTVTRRLNKILERTRSLRASIPPSRIAGSQKQKHSSKP